MAAPRRWLMGGLRVGSVRGWAWAQTAIAVPATLTQAEKALAPAGAARDVTLTGTVTLSAIRGGGPYRFLIGRDTVRVRRTPGQANRAGTRTTRDCLGRPGGHD